MLLTIIIPAFNAQRYLAETLQSVLGCCGSRTEVLVVDDGSTDDTARIAAAFSGSYGNVHLISTENRGVSHARNVGIDAAKGAYVAFLDADDVLCAGALTAQVEALMASCKYDLISFGYIQSEHTLKYGRLFPEEDAVLNAEDPGFHRSATRKHFSSYLYRRSLLQQVRFFEGIRYSEDSVFLYLATRQAKTMRCLNSYWFVYRNNIHSAMHHTNGWGFLLTDHVAAWYRAGQSSGRQDIQWDCYGMAYAQLAQYLRYGARSGIPLKRLQQALEESTILQELERRQGSFWVKEDTVALLEGFRSAPRRTWLRHRIPGLFLEGARNLSRTPLVRMLYFRLKYRCPITAWVQPSAPRLPAPELRKEALPSVSA